MSRDDTAYPGQASPGLDGLPRNLDTAHALLRLGIRGEPRPVDALLERLSRSDGGKWLEAALAGYPPFGDRGVVTTLLDGSGSLEDFEEIKQHGKRLMKTAAARSDRLVALAGYFVGTAAALAHRQEQISSGRREELESAMLDLAAATEGRWQTFFTEAARSLLA